MPKVKYESLLKLLYIKLGSKRTQFKNDKIEKLELEYLNLEPDLL